MEEKLTTFDPAEDLSSDEAVAVFYGRGLQDGGCGLYRARSRGRWESKDYEARCSISEQQNTI